MSGPEFNPRDDEQIDRAAWEAFHRDSVKAELLAKHWLLEMHCNHEAKTDTALCACGWRGMECRNVGQAAKDWAWHVIRELKAGERGSQGERQ